MEARHKVSGVAVSGDDAVLRRLGPEWEVEGSPSKPARKAPAKKAAAKKSDDE